ncbi:hypothetical protein EZV62_015882 [Acer yangbiense]|uniref:ABC transporter domain-containing protein n=1 Tax=Acer yangbiense TaxID=1000413 RepID=A0A5C7HM38_9ROSI|nr:hypothetical protein EZV62_015882 [Acer yangbiense]
MLKNVLCVSITTELFLLQNRAVVTWLSSSLHILSNTQKQRGAANGISMSAMSLFKAVGPAFGAEDVEAGTRKPKFQTEPTLPIYLKAIKFDCTFVARMAIFLAIRLILPTNITHAPGSVLYINFILYDIIVQDSLPSDTFQVIRFKDVSYRVVIKGITSTEEKDNLNGITGSVNPGEVLVLMGPSGRGKTTLLNLLGGWIMQPTVGGSITYNDQIGFVTQDDVLFPHLTVKETLTYAALLRLPKTLAKQQKEKKAIDVIYELGLERCQDTMIGGSFFRGVSGGERKRVCIGNEIIINPSLLFLDEPTSGLDSTTALRTVQMLQDIAEGGKTVITTIHQPSSRLFHRFDKLILLGKGSLLYFGKASEAMIYFQSIGCSPLIAMNPAEFLLDLANGNINDVLYHQNYKIRCKWRTQKMNQEMRNHLQQSGIKERRHEYFGWLRITQVLSTAIILGLLWWQSDSKSPKGLQDQAGLLFFIAVFWGFFPVFTGIFAFPQERAMLSKERAADMYRLSLRLSAAPFFLSMLIVFLSIVAAQGLGLAIGATLMDLKKATTLASVTVMTFMLAGGYFVKYEHITPMVNGMRTDSGLAEVGALVAMVFGYRLLAYLSLRRMKLQSGA